MVYGKFQHVRLMTCPGWSWLILHRWNDDPTSLRMIVVEPSPYSGWIGRIRIHGHGVPVSSIPMCGSTMFYFSHTQLFRPKFKQQLWPSISTQRVDVSSSRSLMVQHPDQRHRPYVWITGALGGVLAKPLYDLEGGRCQCQGGENRPRHRNQIYGFWSMIRILHALHIIIFTIIWCCIHIC